MGRTTTLLVAVALVFVACTKDDPPADSADTGLQPRSQRPSGTTVPEQPAAAEVKDVQPIVSDLLDRYDRVVDKIVADPSKVSDRDGPLAQEFLALFEPDSEFATKSLDGWATWGETGVALKPLEAGTLINVTTIEGIIRPVDEDEVTFAKCTEQNYVRLDDGEKVESIKDEVLPGEGTAVRVDGQWRIRTLSTPEGMLGCGIER